MLGGAVMGAGDAGRLALARAGLSQTQIENAVFHGQHQIGPTKTGPHRITDFDDERLWCCYVSALAFQAALGLVPVNAVHAMVWVDGTTVELRYEMETVADSDQADILAIEQNLRRSLGEGVQVHSLVRPRDETTRWRTQWMDFFFHTPPIPDEAYGDISTCLNDIIEDEPPHPESGDEWKHTLRRHLDTVLIEPLPASVLAVGLRYRRGITEMVVHTRADYNDTDDHIVRDRWRHFKTASTGLVGMIQLTVNVRPQPGPTNHNDMDDIDWIYRTESRPSDP